MNTEVLSFLSELGHNISIKNSNDAFGFGGAQLIRRLPNGFYIGGSESRKDGHVIGF
jgi:gamma-glutamyltranspeptidase/glutathione hydrolase